MTKEISNELMNEFLENNENQKIMNKAARPFRKVLDYDEVENCKRLAMWKALRSYDSEKGSKFTTFLYRGVYFECKGAASQIMKSADNLEFFEEYGNYEQPQSTLENIEWVDEIKNISGGEILFDEYYLGLNLTEIAEKYETNIYQIRKRKKKILDLMHSKIFGV